MTDACKINPKFLAEKNSAKNGNIHSLALETNKNLAYRVDTPAPVY
jgi:hypothetical protein